MITSIAKFWRPQPEASNETVAVQSGRDERTGDESRLARILRYGMSAPDRELLSRFSEYYGNDELCRMLNLPIDKVISERARIRWQLKRLIQRHGLDKSADPAVRSFLKKMFARLSG